MARTHNHLLPWQQAIADERGIEVPPCKYPTKRECDENWRRVQQQRKLEYETVQAAQKEKAKAAREEAFLAFQEKEAQRVKEVLEWSKANGSPSPASIESSTSQMTIPSPTNEEPDGPTSPTPKPMARVIRLAPVIRTPRPS